MSCSSKCARGKLARNSRRVQKLCFVRKLATCLRASSISMSWTRWAPVAAKGPSVGRGTPKKTRPWIRSWSKWMECWASDTKWSFSRPPIVQISWTRYTCLGSQIQKDRWSHAVRCCCTRSFSKIDEFDATVNELLISCWCRSLSGYLGTCRRNRLLNGFLGYVWQFFTRLVTMLIRRPVRDGYGGPLICNRCLLFRNEW